MCMTISKAGLSFVVRFYSFKVISVLLDNFQSFDGLAFSIICPCKKAGFLSFSIFIFCNAQMGHDSLDNVSSRK